MIGSASLYSLITQIISRARSYKEESVLNDNGDNHKTQESNLKELHSQFFCFVFVFFSYHRDSSYQGFGQHTW